MKKEKTELSSGCKASIQGVRDVLDVLGGKWKIPIIASLYYNQKIRFMDLSRQIENIAPEVLSKELKDLEMNHLVKRTIKDTMPITVEYELTAQGKSFNKIIEAMGDWGIKYRKSILKKE